MLTLFHVELGVLSAAGSVVLVFAITMLRIRTARRLVQRPAEAEDSGGS